MTLEKLKAEWHERRLSPKTIALYESEYLLLEALMNRVQDPRRYLSTLAPKTHDNKLTYWAIFLGKDHPFIATLKRPKLRRKQIKFLEVEEVKTLYRNAESEEMKLFISLGGFMGLRLSEILGVSYSDFKNGYLRITRKGSREQNLPIPGAFLPLPFGERSRGKVFEKCSRYYQLELQRISKSCLDKNVNPHMLRHTYASHLAANGVSIVALKELLGHEKLSTTEMYLHVLPEHLTEAANVSDRLFKTETKRKENENYEAHDDLIHPIVPTELWARPSTKT